MFLEPFHLLTIYIIDLTITHHLETGAATSLSLQLVSPGSCSYRYLSIPSINIELYDIAAVASRDRWPSAMAHEVRLLNLIQQILRRGRESGEFERKTPADEAAEAIYRVIKPYASPVLLQYSLDDAEEASAQLAALVLRSLAP